MGVGRLSFLIPGDLPNPGIESMSLVSAVLAGGLLTTVPPGKTSILIGSNKLCTSHCHWFVQKSVHGSLGETYILQLVRLPGLEYMFKNRLGGQPAADGNVIWDMKLTVAHRQQMSVLQPWGTLWRSTRNLLSVPRPPNEAHSALSPSKN